MSEGIAIIGFSGRFPGANSVEQLWRNLENGEDAVREFSEEELRRSALAPEAVTRSDYVRAGLPLVDSDRFDAGFFDLSPREAELTDPQHRVFLECCWEALESAGHDPNRFDGLVGVYAGAAISSYTLLFDPLNGGQLDGLIGQIVGNAPDYLTTRVSYKLNLRGPSVATQTACSSSLVAVHQAVQSLLSRECDMALAGGVAIRITQHEGYVHQPGLTSSEGRCRAFDADAEGTIFGNGAGVVVLRRLADAIKDDDTIYAVIRGSAVNNDGASKAGFTAPGVSGQAEAISEAIAVADISPRSIGYVETHGTGTPLGDTIEVAALTKAFTCESKDRGYCALGSIKTNIGHLESAAGVAGLLKATLALHHAKIPATLNFRRPNPRIPFDQSPFFVNEGLRDWPRQQTPRRAGVSSFGLGGTNAHVVLEEAPTTPRADMSERTELLVVSAKTETALRSSARRLAAHLEATPDLSLSDCAYTLHSGRAQFTHRMALVADDLSSAATTLTTDDKVSDRLEGLADAIDRPVVFMFPGAGSQYPGMARALRRRFVVFNDALEQCHGILKAEDVDLEAVLGASSDDAPLTRTKTALPALVAVEYALAKLWMSLGVRPSAMIGHSVSEYVPACLSGVLSLEDTLALVALRGRLFERMERGNMLGVPLSEAELSELLPDSLTIAALNGPKLSVVSGPTEAISQFAASLEARDVRVQRLYIDVAAHSALIDPILEDFTERVSRCELRSPTVPFVSNVTGTWIENQDATDPRYWARQLRNPVRFFDGVKTLMKDADRVFVEVGPGRTLGTFCRQYRPMPAVVATLPHAQEQTPSDRFFLRGVGHLWTLGATIDWSGMVGERQRRRVPLPTYPFERRRYWPTPSPRSVVAAQARQSPARGEPAAEARLPQPVEAAPSAVSPPPPDVAPDANSPTERELAAMWHQVLGVEAIGRHQNFFELGGHSLAASQIVTKIRQRYSIDFPVRSFFATPTLAGLASAIADATTGPVERLDDDISLDPSITAVGRVGRALGAPDTILLTGATGFLGAFMLRELLARMNARVVCLVRAADEPEARARLDENLAAHEIDISSVAERISVCCGDLAAPRLGLDEAAFATLADQVESIVHGGAEVNFVLPYESLRPANVDGTKEILRLATTGVTKPVFFVSTAAVFSSSEAPKSEDASLRHERAEDLHTGYARSKWVAERVLELARERDIPVCVVRPAAVAGDTATGASNRRDFMVAMMRGCVDLAAAPDIDVAVHIAPAGYVASSIAELVRQPAGAIGRAFHLISPQPLSIKRLQSALRFAGYPLETLPYSTWYSRAVAAVEDRRRDHPLGGFLHLLDGDALRTPPRLDCDRSKATLRARGLECPELDNPTIGRYCDFLVRTGLMPATPRPVDNPSRPTATHREPRFDGVRFNMSDIRGSQWSWGFRLGFFDFFMPVNYDQSLRRALDSLKLQPKERAVDIGSGSGRILVHAAPWLTDGGKLTCIDLDEGGLSFSKSRAQRLGVTDNIEHRKADVSELGDDFRGRYDAAIAHFSLYCIPSDQGRRRATRNIANMLKPGGRLAIAVPSELYTAQRLIADARNEESRRADIPGWMKTVRRRFIYPVTRLGTARLEKAMDEGRFHRYSRAELEEHLHEAGFVDIEIIPTYGQCGHFAIAQKPMDH